jgi:hypothetical protein
VVALAGTLAIVSLAIQLVGIFKWDSRYHGTFDKGWGAGRNWVWQAPYEPLWDYRNAPFYKPERILFF